MLEGSSSFSKILIVVNIQAVEVDAQVNTKMLVTKVIFSAADVPFDSTS
jgi:hypothetical protein